MKYAVGRLVNSSSNRHFHGYFWVWVVPLNLEVVNGEVLNVFHLPFDEEFGKGFWVSCQLLLEGFHVVEVDVGIPKGVDELAGLQAGHVSNHVSQQGIAAIIRHYETQCFSYTRAKNTPGDVKGHSEPHVGRPLIELATQFTVSYVELDKTVAGRKGH